jgi:alcohol dehydrogenase class IV
LTRSGFHDVSPAGAFRWQDGERLIVFGRGTLADAPELLSGSYDVLTTARAHDSAAVVIEGARAVHLVGPGRVDELAAELLPSVSGELLVALGGGRVIDVAKALAAANPPSRVAAIPTTLSGAEMTAVHRHAAGVRFDTARVRPAIVVNDPALSASQPLDRLAESAANALGHALEGPLTPLGNPVAALTALEATERIAAVLGDRAGKVDLSEAERDSLALAALLAGYVIGSTGYGLHHVVSQTLARFAGVRHGAANAIMLPGSTDALARRSPAAIAGFRERIGLEPVALAERIRDLTGVSRLRDAGVTDAQLRRCVEEAAARPELSMTPPPAGESELRDLYEAAY